MDKDDKKPKSCVSTFRWVLKPHGWTKEKVNGLDTTNKVAMAKNKLGMSSATGKHLKIWLTEQLSEFQRDALSLLFWWTGLSFEYCTTTGKYW